MLLYSVHTHYLFFSYSCTFLLKSLTIFVNSFILYSYFSLFYFNANYWMFCVSNFSLTIVNAFSYLCDFSLRIEMVCDWVAEVSLTSKKAFFNSLMQLWEGCSSRRNSNEHWSHSTISYWHSNLCFYMSFRYIDIEQSLRPHATMLSAHSSAMWADKSHLLKLRPHYWMHLTVTCKH